MVWLSGAREAGLGGLWHDVDQLSKWPHAGGTQTVTPARHMWDSRSTACLRVRSPPNCPEPRGFVEAVSLPLD
jgi:hypothetical protein